MARYYYATYVGMLVALAALASAVALTHKMTTASLERQRGLMERLQMQSVACQAAQGRAEAARKQTQPADAFLRAWKPHLQPVTAGLMRTTLETLAQTKLGLVTDDTVEPEPTLMRYRNHTTKVQRVGIRASGESLVALMTWLGEVEKTYPYAKVESFDLAASQGRNCQLRVALALPQLPKKDKLP